MNNEKPFHSWGVGRFHLNFPNGNQISTVWGSGTYSDNYDNQEEIDILLKKSNKRLILGSNTVEIMFSCPDKLRKKILKKYNEGSEDPIGYLPLKDWLEIVKLLSK